MLDGDDGQPGTNYNVDYREEGEFEIDHLLEDFQKGDLKLSDHFITRRARGEGFLLLQPSLQTEGTCLCMYTLVVIMGLVVDIWKCTEP